SSATAFQFVSGTLRLTNSSMTVGVAGLLGSNFQLNGDQHLEVTGGGLTVDPSALLYLNGGSALAGSLTNNGQIQLSGPTSLLSGGALSNNGMVAGSGRIANTLTNNLLGVVRANQSDWLQFSGVGNSNSGQINLLN